MPAPTGYCIDIAAMMRDFYALKAKVTALEIKVEKLTSDNRQRNEIKPCALSEHCLAYGAHECMLHLCRKFITV